MELASDAPGPQLGDLTAPDRAGLEDGQGLGEADAEDDPWQIPASHEVLLQGMLRIQCSSSSRLRQLLLSSVHCMRTGASACVLRSWYLEVQHACTALS